VSESLLLVDKRDGVVTLTLNRPRQMNALSRALMGAIGAGIRDASTDPEVGVIILTGAGERAFCAGLDLKELGGETKRPSSTGTSILSGHQMIGLIENSDVPIIGAINGVAITGGFELALACDILIGCPETRFADTHARVGIMPGWGLSQKLSRLVGIYRAKELSLTGNFLGAEQAERWGLLNRVVPSDALLPVCHELAQDILSCEREMVRSYKKTIDEGFASTYADGRALESERNREHGQVAPEEIAERRRKIQDRGRIQAQHASSHTEGREQ